MAHWLRAEDHDLYAAKFKDVLEYGYLKFGITGIIGTLL
jgi:hypothetical protein